MTESLWLDEATTALVSKMSLGDIFTKFLPGDFHPPLYYLFMKFWVDIFGNSEVSLRTPSLIFAILTVWLVYKLAGRAAALLLATAPLLFYYAKEARMYSLVTLLVCCLVYLFTNKKWGLFSIFLVLLGMTDYVALLIIPIFWILGWRFRKKLVICHLPLVISYLWWLPFFLLQLQGGLKVAYDSPVWGQLLGQTSFKNIALIPVKFMIGRVGFDDKWLYGLIVAMVGLLFGYLLIRAIRSIRLIWLWFLVPLALGILVSFWIPVLSYFRFLFVLPAFYILVARGIGRSRSILFLVFSFNLLLVTYYLLTPRFHREDWKGAAAAIGDGQIVLPADSQKEALAYYGKSSQIVGQPSEEEIWLSRYVWEVSDPSDDVRYKIEDQGYEKTGEYNFNGIVFWKYAYRN